MRPFAVSGLAEHVRTEKGEFSKSPDIFYTKTSYPRNSGALHRIMAVGKLVEVAGGCVLSVRK